MRACRSVPSVFLLAGVVSAAQAQGVPGEPRLHLGPTVSYMAYGAYFEGPGSVRFSNEDGLAVGVQLDWRVSRRLGVAASGSRASSDWRFTGVPIVGTVDVGGATLWLADIGLRVELLPDRRVRPFVQLGAGIIRYEASNALIDERATNVAAVGVLGATVRVGPHLRAELAVKDHYASFRSVDAVASVGAEGRRAHTLAVTAGASLGL